MSSLAVLLTLAACSGSSGDDSDTSSGDGDGDGGSGGSGDGDGDDGSGGSGDGDGDDGSGGSGDGDGDDGSGGSGDGDGDDGSGGSGNGDGGSGSGGDAGSGGNVGSGGSSATELEYAIVMSTLLDGDDSHGEQARNVAFDSQGNMIVVGGTSADDYPTTTGAYDQVHGGPSSTGIGSGGDYDVFVTKFDPDGNLLWSTFLGNGAYDRAYAVDVGPGDDVYIGGRAGPNFPTTPGVYQEDHQGDNQVNGLYGEQDAFVTRLKSDGSDIVWSTYVGEAGRGFARDIAVGPTGEVYVALSTVTGAFNPEPTTWGPREAPDGFDGFYGVLSADGTELVYGTYLGGSSNDLEDGARPSIQLDENGDVFLFTFTPSPDFECISDDGYDSTHNGGLDYVVARFNGGTDLQWCTFLGGDGDDTSETHALAIDASGNPVIATGTNSTNLPTTTGPTTRNGPTDGYIAVLSADGKSLVAARYLGGSAADWIEGVAVTPGGDIVVSGGTESDDLPVTSLSLKQTRQGRDGHFFQLTPDLTQIRYGTLLGGSGQDDIRSVWVSPTGLVGLVGSTQSTDYPTVGAVDSGSYAGNNAVVATLLSIE